MIITKFKAFAIHLGISFLIFLVLAWFLVFRWFPGDLFFINGGWQGLRIIAAVDLVLGPMLTLVLYKPGKPNLKFDMSVIVLMQALALSYGVWAAHQQSIQALAFFEGQFVPVTYDGLKQGDKKMREAGKPVQAISTFGTDRPAQIFLVPVPSENYGSYITSVLNGLPELHERSHRYRPLKDNLEKITGYQVTLDQLGEKNGALKQRLDDYFSERGEKPGDFQLYNLQARYSPGIVIVDPQEKQIIDIIRYSHPKPTTKQAAETAHKHGEQEDPGQKQVREQERDQDQDQGEYQQQAQQQNQNDELDQDRYQDQDSGHQRKQQDQSQSHEQDNTPDQDQDQDQQKNQ